MTRVIEIPAHLDDRSFEQFAAGFGAWPPEEKLLFDARSAQWASPYGLIGMLTAGQALAEARSERPLFAVPASADVKSYWSRVGFFRYATDLFELHGKVPKVSASGPSDALLDITPVRAMEDVHDAVGAQVSCASDPDAASCSPPHGRRARGGQSHLGDGGAHPPRGARAGADGDRALQYGAFGGLSEYC